MLHLIYQIHLCFSLIYLVPLLLPDFPADYPKTFLSVFFLPEQRSFYPVVQDQRCPLISSIPIVKFSISFLISKRSIFTPLKTIFFCFIFYHNYWCFSNKQRNFPIIIIFYNIDSYKTISLNSNNIVFFLFLGSVQ